MKTNEEFRASVYARAECEKQRINLRRQKMRNASLSVAMMLLVAAIAVPLARNARGSADSFTAPAFTQEDLHIVNPAALGTRMVLLVGTQAVVLENEAQQKAFVSKYKAAMNLGDGEGAPFPAADTAKAIHSIDELSEFLAELPEAAESMKADYNEAFFAGNDLYAMPMALAPQSENTATREPTTTEATTTIPAQAFTISDAIIPEATIPDAVAPSNADAPPDPTQAETTLEDRSIEAFTSFPDSELLQSPDVTVLLLVPVNKG